ncbi:hypothetical protein [uncultured Rheinheimera sp.]|uniref:hypothetical protein n=1 Tax=uncultured Rheinheimera sp. TaxID=400532 RepID=UPI002595EC11|nr:hypothetical protein [uncultured Rheinheimera sp.]
MSALVDLTNKIKLLKLQLLNASRGAAYLEMVICVIALPALRELNINIHQMCRKSVSLDKGNSRSLWLMMLTTEGVCQVYSDDPEGSDWMI